MKTPKQFYQKSKLYKALRQQIVLEHGETSAREIFDNAEKRLTLLWRQYAGIPEGERMHVQSNILPRAAVYLAMKDRLGDAAFPLLNSVGTAFASKIGDEFAKLTSTMVMSRIFLRVFALMTKTQFGKRNGFRQTFYKTEKGVLKFDILQCPYQTYFGLCGCPEIAALSCESDVHCYGKLPHIEFIRTMTLAKGGDKCDFALRLHE